MSLKRPPAGSPGGVGLTFEGLPYQGPIQDYKDNDPIDQQPQIKYKAHVEIFDLSDEKQLAEYETVVQKIVGDTAVLSSEEKEYDPDKKSWRVLIVYSDIFYTAPDKNAK